MRQLEESFDVPNFVGGVAYARSTSAFAKSAAAVNHLPLGVVLWSEHSTVERGRESMSHHNGNLQEPSAVPRATIWALYAAIAMPLLYFGTQLVAAPFYPGYSFSQDTASMLGTTDSLHPWIFNCGAMLTGVAGLVGAVGLFQALQRTTWTALALVAALCVAANGVLSVKAGMFPMPDPRHASWQFLLFPILLAPVLFVVATWRVSWALRVYLIVDLVFLGVLMPFMMHWVAPMFGEGTMQRLFALAIFVPIGVVAWFLYRDQARQLRG